MISFAFLEHDNNVFEIFILITFKVPKWELKGWKVKKRNIREPMYLIMRGHYFIYDQNERKQTKDPE